MEAQGAWLAALGMSSYPRAGWELWGGWASHPSGRKWRFECGNVLKIVTGEVILHSQTVGVKKGDNMPSW